MSGVYVEFTNRDIYFNRVDIDKATTRRVGKVSGVNFDQWDRYEDMNGKTRRVSMELDITLGGGEIRTVSGAILVSMGHTIQTILHGLMNGFDNEALRTRMERRLIMMEYVMNTLA
jgi:hypothetical protein